MANQRKAKINDYLTELYYTDNRAYSYTVSFLKIFYLIFGQAYSRNYLGAELYDKLCKNKNTKIHMPKIKVDEETDIIIFNDEQMNTLSDYFKGTNDTLFSPILVRKATVYYRNDRNMPA